MRIRLCYCSCCSPRPLAPARSRRPCIEERQRRGRRPPAAIVAGRSVVVSDGYIKEIGAQESVRAPAGARASSIRAAVT